jgi:hypothetical protein
MTVFVLIIWPDTSRCGAFIVPVQPPAVTGGMPFNAKG